MVDFARSTGMTIPDGGLQEFQALTKSLSKVVQDQTFYRLIVILMLTSPDEFDNTASAISNLHWHYLVLLRGRVEWCARKTIYFEEIMKSLKELPRLRAIAEMVSK